MKYDDKTILEWCPYCNTEVELDNCMQMQKCPNCEKDIAPCNTCFDEDIRDLSDNCDECPIGCNDADKTCNRYLVSANVYVYAKGQTQAIDAAKRLIAADGYRSLSIIQTGRKNAKRKNIKNRIR